MHGLWAATHLYEQLHDRTQTEGLRLTEPAGRPCVTP
ncbi:hypothetical protein ABIA33_002338 [Streptacidiphilus sp. MAP12-16]